MELGEQRRLLQQVREWFDSRVDHYAEEAPSGPTHAEAELLTRLPGPPARVIDVGCGAGRVAFALVELGYQVTGVDVSHRLLVAARASAVSRGLNVRLAVIGSTSQPFAANRFDGAVAIKVYAFVPSQRRRLDYLAEISRVLRPSGVLLLTSYVAPSEHAAASALAGDACHLHASSQFASLEPLDTFIEGRGYVHWFTEESLLAELSRSEFVIEAIERDEERRQVLVTLRKPQRVPE
jgi:SAM-dependent methyltransferase